MLDLAVSEGKQNATKYIQILKRKKIHMKLKLGSYNFIFQQDNASIYSAMLVKTWVKINKIGILEWPFRSPDPNIIENVWGWLTRKLYDASMIIKKP